MSILEMNTEPLLINEVRNPLDMHVSINDNDGQKVAGRLILDELYPKGTYSAVPHNITALVPLTYARFKHPAHEHGLFMGFGQRGHVCDVANCRTEIERKDTRFFCQRCDFDLCVQCFSFFEPHVPRPLAENDAEVDVTVGLPLVFNPNGYDDFDDEER